MKTKLLSFFTLIITVHSIIQCVDIIWITQPENSECSIFDIDMYGQTQKTEVDLVGENREKIGQFQLKMEDAEPYGLKNKTLKFSDLNFCTLF
ncbi:hypothetical protein [Tenacibaculum agarivorans]|uniref:hypothetical protein n=1 Tax=Tenacibaculum agarivorans TaxID=1908389 RepID=UPI00094BC337|nr:hypothetical protein [Tenacibaculum agarivorans]